MASPTGWDGYEEARSAESSLGDAAPPPRGKTASSDEHAGTADDGREVSFPDPEVAPGDADLRVGDEAEGDGERSLGAGEHGLEVSSDGDGDPPALGGKSSDGLSVSFVGVGDDDGEEVADLRVSVASS